MTRLSIGAVIALLCCVTAPWALASGMPKLSFNGFGTIGLVHSDEDQADFVADSFAPDGVGHSRDWSAEVDSRLGLQLTAELTPRLSAVGQVVVEQRYDDTYEPTVEWANLTFDIASDLSIRAGRMVLPMFMTSEYRKVGYAYPWVRPPQEIYFMVPVTNVDGIDVSYRARSDGFTNTLQITYGGTDTRTSTGARLKARDLMTVVDTLEWGATTLFARYATARMTLEHLIPLFEAFRGFGTEGEAIAQRYSPEDARSNGVGLGMRIDPGDWFVMGEWARSWTDSFVTDRRGWYLTGGLRYGSVTPYATVAYARVDGNISDPGLTLAGLPPAAAQTAAELNASLDYLLSRAAPQQRSLSVGTRWDFAANAALKLQLDHIDLDDDSAGVLINVQPGFRRGGTVSVFSVAVDLVF